MNKGIPFYLANTVCCTNWEQAGQEPYGLAVHIGLEEYRAIKRISKRDADYDTSEGEALIAKRTAPSWDSP